MTFVPTARAEAVLGRIGGGLFQQAFVVNDRSAAEEAMIGFFGCTRFVSFDMPGEWMYRGRLVSCTLSLAFGRSGNMQIELMQPLEGEGLHFEFLERRGPGLHHLGVLVDDLDRSIAEAEADGVAPAMVGGFAGVRIAYLDTLDDLGVYLELIEDPNGMLARTMPWRDEQERS